jgi:hypothetical protein
VALKRQPENTGTTHHCKTLPLANVGQALSASAPADDFATVFGLMNK